MSEKREIEFELRNEINRQKIRIAELEGAQKERNIIREMLQEIGEQLGSTGDKFLPELSDNDNAEEGANDATGTRETRETTEAEADGELGNCQPDPQLSPVQKRRRKR